MLKRQSQKRDRRIAKSVDVSKARMLLLRPKAGMDRRELPPIPLAADQDCVGRNAMLQLIAPARRRLLAGWQVAIPNPALSGRRHVPGRYFWCRLWVISAATMNSRLGGTAAYANGDQRDQTKAKAKHCGYLRSSSEKLGHQIMRPTDDTGFAA